MLVQFTEVQAGGWLFTITDSMGELVHSAGVFDTQQKAIDAAKAVCDPHQLDVLQHQTASLPTSPLTRDKHISEILDCVGGMDVEDFQELLTTILTTVVDDSVINQIHNTLDLK
jgi:hypothetical protein